MRYIREIIAIITIVLIITGSMIIVINNEENKLDNAISLIPNNIWSYQNQKSQPEDALVFTFQYEQWQASVAVALTPAFIDRTRSTPIMFDDESESRNMEIPHETLSVLDFGTDEESATANIAFTYWSKAEIVILADNYEHVLWSVPIASFLSAPILITPTEVTLKNLGTKCAINIGESPVSSNIETIINLKTKKDVWKFQLDLYESVHQKCDYIIITNPNDTNDILNSSITWPYLSIASAPLAAFRNAIVQTGDYTTDRAMVDKIAQGLKKNDEIYNQIKPYFQKVKQDSYLAEKFLLDSGHEPRFMAIVGGNYAVPDYVFDFHITYFYWSAKLDYVFSPAPYGDIENKLEYENYPQQEVEIGRIIGHSILDASIQLTRTFFYKEFLTNGKYNSFLSKGWENKASVVEGHRVNQPNAGGPPISNDKPFFPAGEIFDVFSNSGYLSTYYLPRNITDPSDDNLPINKILSQAANSSLVLINAHGGVPGKETLLEIGLDPDLNNEYVYTINGDVISQQPLAPAIVYLIGCDTGSTALYFNKDDYLTLGFIHSGAVAYLAPESYQTICYWDQSPAGPEGSQAIYFFEGLIDQNLPIGTAMAEAKWKSYQEWFNDTSSEDDVGPITLKLYGDPAFKLHKINRDMKNNKPSVRSEQSQKTRQGSSSENIYSPIDLSWDKTTTISGKYVCGNISIANFGRLIIKDADLEINGIINISDYGSIFIENSTIKLSPPPLDEETSVLKLDGNAIIRSYHSSLTIIPSTTPTSVPFVLMGGGSTFLFSNGTINIKLPILPRDPEEKYKIKANVPGTAGVVLIIDSAVWRVEESILNINSNYEKINGSYILMSSWYVGTVQGEVVVTFDNVYVNFDSSLKIFEPIKGTMTFIDSSITGNFKSGGLTDMIIINSTITGDLGLTDRSITKVVDSRIIGKVLNGLWSESKETPEAQVEIKNSVIEKGLTCSGEGTAEIYNTTIEEGALINDNASVVFDECTIRGVILQEDGGKSEITKSLINSFFLKDQSQVTLDNAIMSIDSIAIYYDCKSHLSIKNSNVRSFNLFGDNSLQLSFVNTTTSKISLNSNTTINFELYNSKIIGLLIFGENIELAFIMKNSTIPELPFNENVRTYIKYLLEVETTLNNKPINTEIEVYNDDGLVDAGITNENGKIIFPLIHSIVSSSENLIIENYSVKTSYMGFSEMNNIRLNKSKETHFSLFDTEPPRIIEISYDPKTWNINWQVTIEAIIIDDTIEAIANATIFYSTNQGKTWREVEMQNVGENKYEGIIPGQNTGTNVRFYIVTYDRAGNIQKSITKEYNVGSESIILIYVLIIIGILITAMFVKRWITKKRTIHNYFHKFDNKSDILMMTPEDGVSNIKEGTK